MYPAFTESQSKHIRELLRDASARREHGEFAIEGPHLLDVALEKKPEQLLLVAFTAEAASRHVDLIQKCELKKILLYSIAPKLASRISDTEEPQGIFAVLKIFPSAREAQGDIIIALDGVQDPGNVGTIIRTAAWFGVKSMILSEGTADPYSSKIVRSTQGALFDVNIETKADLHVRLRFLQKDGWRLVAASLGATAKSLYDTAMKGKTIVLLGSEAHGIRKELLTLANENIVIPSYGEGESLNVATSAAIILAELRRRSL
jgi:TrmH family RNA methyltransferase